MCELQEPLLMTLTAEMLLPVGCYKNGKTHFFHPECRCDDCNMMWLAQPNIKTLAKGYIVPFMIYQRWLSEPKPKKKPCPTHPTT